MDESSTETRHAGGAQLRANVWSAGVQAMVPVPAEHRRLKADVTAVQATLRCGEEEIESLRRCGVVWVERGGVPLFDPVDIYNLGLLSGSGRTVPRSPLPTSPNWQTRAARPGPPPAGPSWSSIGPWQAALNWSASSAACASRRGTPRGSRARPTCPRSEER